MRLKYANDVQLFDTIDTRVFLRFSAVHMNALVRVCVRVRVCVCVCVWVCACACA